MLADNRHFGDPEELEAGEAEEISKAA